MSFNKVILVGNLTRAPELKYTSGKGTPVTKTGIAVNRKATINGELREEVCFVDLTFWGRTAEIANQYLQKGSKVLIEGRLVYETWQDQNGQNRSKHSITVDSMEMLGNKEQNQGYDNGGYDNYGGGYTNNNSYGNAGNFGGVSRGFGGQNNYPQSNNYPQQNNFGSQGAYQQNSQASYQQGGFGGQNANFANQTRQNQPQNEPKEPELPVYDVDKDEIPF